MSQFRNKAEAQQAIQDMKRREEKAQASADFCAELGQPARAEGHAQRVDQYRAEAARIREMLPTLSD